MNAVVLAHGFTCGGREGARQALKDFWESVATKAPFNAMAESPSTPAGNGSLGSAAPLKAFLLAGEQFPPDRCEIVLQPGPDSPLTSFPDVECRQVVSSLRESSVGVP